MPTIITNCVIFHSENIRELECPQEYSDVDVY